MTWVSHKIKKKKKNTNTNLKHLLLVRQKANINELSTSPVVKEVKDRLDPKATSRDLKEWMTSLKFGGTNVKKN